MPKVVLFSAVFILLLNSTFFLLAMSHGLSGYFLFFILSSLIGMSLFVPQRKAWQFAWTLTFFVWLLLIFYWIVPEQTLEVSSQVRFFQTVIVTTIVLCLFAIHRWIKFPYFDRRKKFFGEPALRHNLMTAMTFPEHPHLVGSTMNLSMTGCKTSFDVSADIDLQKGEYVWFCFPEVSDQLLQARVVGVEKPFIRFEFSPLTKEYREQLGAFLVKNSQHRSLPGSTQ